LPSAATLLQGGGEAAVETGAMNLPFHLLTGRERSYLLLTHQGFSSKQIAAMEGIRPDRVDKVINSARAKCGGITRRELARRLFLYEGSDISGEVADTFRKPPPKTGAQTMPLADGAALPSNGSTQPSDDGSDGGADRKDVENGSPFPHPPPRALSGFNGSSRNDLRPLSTSLAIVSIAAVGALTAGAVLSLYFVLDRLAAGH
jgi:DNA-binding CsgD family transcriptional regulator